MSAARCEPGRVTLFVVSIALAGGLTAHVAVEATQQPPSPPAVAPPPADPNAVMSKPDSTGPAPGVAAGMPSQVTITGKIGPGGSVAGPSAGPAEPAGSLDPAIEKLGPAGAAGRTATEVRLGPGGTLSPTSAGGPTGPDGRPVIPTANTQPTTMSAQLPPERNPGANGSTAQGGMAVFIDPATGRITAPTDAQLRQLDEAQRQNTNGSAAPATVVERPAVDGMMADVPESLYQLVTATVGADGDVTVEERQAGPTSEQPLRAEGVQHLGPAGDRDQNLSMDLSSDASITIVNGDGAGEGFNDGTVVAPVFGNRGTTRGQQRLNAFRAAAEYWGSILRSTVPIRIDARMDPQFCTATSAVLGSAGPRSVHRDFGGAPRAATWYVQAVANSRNGTDLNPTTNDINAIFNSDIDNATCLGATSWWYGIGAPAPAGTVDFYTVVLHEIGHGIGALSLVSLSTGAKFGGFDDAYERWLWDWNTGGWPNLSNAGRLASSVNTGQVIFWGPRATAAGRGFLSAGLNAGYPRVYAPNPVQGGSSISHFDTVLTPNELMEPAITPPPGPYAHLTGGLLEDIGWSLLANGVFDFGAIGTWTWNGVDGWFQPTTANPTLLEAWNGNFVGVYGGTWLWNETTSTWSQLTSAGASQLKACGNNLLWTSAAFGMWRWNPSTGWSQLTGASPQSMDCLGGDAVWEGASGTWLYSFDTSAWRMITSADPLAVRSCGSRLIWWWGAGTWAWSDATGWTQLTGAQPQSIECYRNSVAWESALGTWIYSFTAGWSQITAADPGQILTWGPNLVWSSAAFGTWIWTGTGWAQITSANPTLMEVLGPDLLWSWPTGTWVWSGAGGGAGWTSITTAVPTQIVSAGAVK